MMIAYLKVTKAMYWFRDPSRTIRICLICSAHDAVNVSKSWQVIVEGTARIHTVWHCSEAFSIEISLLKEDNNEEQILIIFTFLH